MYADSIRLNSTEYSVEVKLVFHEVGDYLTTVGVVYNHSDIMKLNHVVYNTYGGSRQLIAIDHQGRVTVKQKFT